jgi:hypothetical protein
MGIVGLFWLPPLWLFHIIRCQFCRLVCGHCIHSQVAVEGLHDGEEMHVLRYILPLSVESRSGESHRLQEFALR